jgi:retinol dehydrogenase-12
MAPYSFLSFVSNQFRSLPDVEPQDLSGRVVIVSGSNIGLGLEAARHFARMKPAKLILAVRDVKKGQAAAEDIVRSTSCSTIDVWAVDQTSFQSVKAFCDRVDKELDRLDMCVILR